jgi:hypothetical protein
MPVENGKRSLRDTRFRGERVAWLEYRRATRRPVTGTRFRGDRGELFARARARAGGDGVDSRRRVHDGRCDEWQWQLRNADGFE